VPNATTEIPEKRDYQILALFAFLTGYILPCIGQGSIEWKDVALLNILSIQISTGNLERRQNCFYFSIHESGSLYRYVVTRRIH
jgi:hypothetical protein